MNRFPLSPLFLILLPLLEIYLLVEIGGLLGGLLTVIWVIGSALLGIGVIRLQGLAALQRMQQAMGQGGLPATAMLESTVMAMGGLLLVIPGFLTDSLGLLTLIGPLRRRLVAAMVGPRGDGGSGSATPGDPFARRPERRVIDGEYTREDP